MSTAIPTGDPAAKLLSRLEKVRQFGPRRWMARCPAHDDRTPSLSVKETDDGTLLIRCWVGCSAAEIVAAVGLGLSDLFPRPPERPHTPGARMPWRGNAREALLALAGELAVIHAAAGMLGDGLSLSGNDMARLVAAIERVQNAIDTVGGRRHG